MAGVEGLGDVGTGKLDNDALARSAQVGSVAALAEKGEAFWWGIGTGIKREVGERG
jgi:hypothetical protein